MLPSIYKQHEERYAAYTLRQLCQEMHDLYARHNVKQLQKEMFRKEHFPRVSMNPQEANYAYLRGEVELVRLPDAEGRIAAEGALPYPPGVLCVVPGEIWGGAVLRYFSALEEGINLLRVLHRSFRVSISKNMMVVSKFGAMSSSLVMRKAPC